MGFRRAGFAPAFAATDSRIFIATRSIGTHVPTSTRAAHLPTRLRLSGVLLGIGIQLSPAHFRLAHLSRLGRCRTVRYYALLRRWLLLSLRPVCLEASVPCNFTLSWNLGALTQVSVVPVTAHQLTRCNPTPCFFDECRFGV